MLALRSKISKSIVAGLALAGVLLADLAIAAPLPADGASAYKAATEWSAQRRPRARTRIDIYRPRLITRQCTDWYVEERRPSGTVITPRMRCWWVRG